MARQIEVAADALVARGGDDRVRLGMDAPAQLIPLAARDLHLLTHAIAQIAAVFASARRAVVAAGHDLVVAHDDRAILPPQAGRPFEHGLGNVQIIIFLHDPGHNQRLLLRQLTPGLL